MIRKLIIIILALIGIAALVYFGFDWLKEGFSSVKDQAGRAYEDIKEIPQKINDLTSPSK